VVSDFSCPLTRGTTMWKLLFILAALVFVLVSGATAIAVTTALQTETTIGSVILKPPGSASSSPTMRNVCSRPSSVRKVAVMPKVTVVVLKTD
jgi:hypothetical protein